MPFPLNLASGGGAIPITGGAATSGDVGTDVRFAPVNVGGLFGSSAQSGNQFLLPAIIVAVGLVLFSMRKK